RPPHRHVDSPRHHRTTVAGERGERGRPVAGRDQEPGAAKLVHQLPPGHAHGESPAHTVTVEPALASSPATGAVRRTRPTPRRSTRNPRRCSTSAACRTVAPWTSGTWNDCATESGWVGGHARTTGRAPGVGAGPSLVDSATSVGARRDRSI